MDSFSALSDDVLILIFENCDPLSLVSMSSTCRRCYILLQNTQFVYSILCYRYGYTSGPPDAKITTADRLAALQAHIPRLSKIQENMGPCLTFGDTPRGEITSLSCGLLAVGLEGSPIITFYDLSASTTPKKRDRWTIDTKVDVKSFCINHYHALLVILDAQSDGVSRIIHLRSIFTGRELPPEETPITTLVFPQGEMNGSVSGGGKIKLSDTHVGVLFYFMGWSNELAVWDWRSGELQLHIKTSEICHVSDFAFISPIHVLVGWNKTEFTADNTEVAQEPSSILLYNLSGRGKPARPKRFGLPQSHLNGRNRLGMLEINSSLPSVPGSHSPRLFYAAPDEGITHIFLHRLFIGAGISRPPDPDPSAIVTFNSTFLKDDYINSSCSRPSQPPYRENAQTECIAWEDWGEECRVFRDWIRSSGMPILHGTKMVNLVLDDFPGHRRIILYDFGRHRNHHGAIHSERQQEGQEPGRKLTRPNVYLEPIDVGAMPYRVLQSEQPFETTNALEAWIDEDNLYIWSQGMRNTIQVLTF